MGYNYWEQYHFFRSPTMTNTSNRFNLRTAAATALAATMCATVVVSNAGAATETATPTSAVSTTTQASESTTSSRATVTQTVTVTPTVTAGATTSTTATTTTTTTSTTNEQIAVLQAFSSGDFSKVRTSSVVLFVMSIITGILTLVMNLDTPQNREMLQKFGITLPF